MAIDLGERRVGVAVSDALGWMAHPLCVLKPRGPRQLIHEIRRLAQDQGVSRLVVGLPVNMDGSEGPRAQAAREFGEALSQAAGLPVEWVDERLSTRAAHAVLLESDTRQKTRKAKIDQVAAALILESWLTRRRLAAEES